MSLFIEGQLTQISKRLPEEVISRLGQKAKKLGKWREVLIRAKLARRDVSGALEKLKTPLSIAVKPQTRKKAVCGEKHNRGGAPCPGHQVPCSSSSNGPRSKAT